MISLLLVSLPVFASSSNETVKDKDNQVILVLEGVAEKMTKEIALQRLNEYNLFIQKNDFVDNEVETRAGVTYYDKYVPKTSNYEFDYSQKKPVTPWVKASSNSDSLSYGESVSVSSSFSGSLTTGELSAMASKLGFSYNRTASSNTSFSQSFRLTKGKTSRVVFSPAVVKTSGTLQRWRHSDMQLNPTLESSKSVSNVKLLQKVGRFADGVYELQTK